MATLSILPYDDGHVTSIALLPDAAWARSEFPCATVTVDFDSDDRIIAVEAAGDRRNTLIADILLALQLRR